MRIFIRLVIVIVVLGLVFGGIFYWKQQQWQQMQAQMSQPQPPATVASAEARREQWQPALRSTGSLTAVNGVAVTTEVAGKVERIAFQSSTRVSDGDVLIQLDSAIDRAALDGLVADRELAKVQFDRAANLLPRRAVSRSEYDEARARFEAAKAAVAEQQARIARKTIRAPFDGLLGLRQVDQGEYLSPGNDIVQIQALDPIYADYSVPERQFSAVSVGQPVEVVVDAYPERVFKGEVTAIDSGVDEGTRTVRVRATLANPDASLRPGMFAEVRTLAPEKTSVVTVPRTAISFNTYGDYVFAIESGEDDTLTVSQKQVTTGRVQNGRVEVAEGLQAGQRVVRAGLVKLRNGQKVTIDNSVELNGGKGGE